MPYYNPDGSINDGTGPGNDGFAVTPSDSVYFTQYIRALYVGVTGDVTLVTASNQVLLFKNWPQGLIIPIRAVRVNATGTTATNLIGII